MMLTTGFAVCAIAHIHSNSLKLNFLQAKNRWLHFLWCAPDGSGRALLTERDQIVKRDPIKKSADQHTLSNPRSNDLLAALPIAEYARWLPHLEAVHMPLGQVLSEAGSKLTHAYFPTSAVVSLLYLTDSGSSVELAVVGREGIVGISLFMGGGSTPSRSVVQSAGDGYRLRASVLLQEFNRAGPVMHLLLRFTQALLTQISQTAVCNRHHTLHQQLCRRLLFILDRSTSREITLTQAMIARMLGVRREGVSKAMFELQKAGFIAYQRGRISVLNREAIQHCTCECYGVIKREYDRLLPAPTTT